MADRRDCYWINGERFWPTPTVLAPRASRVGWRYRMRYYWRRLTGRGVLR